MMDEYYSYFQFHPSSVLTIRIEKRAKPGPQICTSKCIRPVPFPNRTDLRSGSASRWSPLDLPLTIWAKSHGGGGGLWRWWWKKRGRDDARVDQCQPGGPREEGEGSSRRGFPRRRRRRCPRRLWYPQSDDAFFAPDFLEIDGSFPFLKKKGEIWEGVWVKFVAVMAY